MKEGGTFTTKNTKGTKKPRIGALQKPVHFVHAVHLVHTIKPYKAVFMIPQESLDCGTPAPLWLVPVAVPMAQPLGLLVFLTTASIPACVFPPKPLELEALRYFVIPGLDEI